MAATKVLLILMTMVLTKGKLKRCWKYTFVIIVNKKQLSSTLSYDFFCLYISYFNNLNVLGIHTKAIGLKYKQRSVEKYEIRISLNDNNKTEILSFDVTTYLNRSNNLISTLHSDYFKDFKRLKTLLLSNNAIETIPPNVFNNLNVLRHLFLDGNKIKEINNHTFSGLDSLSTLNISNNQIKVLSDTALIPMSQLENLDVSYNRLEELDVDTVTKLKYLRIVGNFFRCDYLVEMDKASNGRFQLTGSDSNHTNFRGISCSKYVIDIDDNTTYEKFLKIISIHQQYVKKNKSAVLKEHLLLIAICVTLAFCVVGLSVYYAKLNSR